MRAVVQRVTRAAVRVDGEVIGMVDERQSGGLCVLLGVTHDDTADEARWMADKLANLRVLRDPDDPDATMERSVLDLDSSVLVVSQFTLYGDARKGRRPSWIDAARPEQAEPLVDAVVARLEELGVATATGAFGADMQVELINDGPVTVLLER